MTRNQTDTARARIAWLSPDDASIAHARSQFAPAGYTLLGEAESGADLAVIDLRAQRISARAARRLTILLRKSAPECGIVYLGSPFLSAAERAHWRRTGDLVLVEENLRPAVDVCRQRLRIRNVAEETGERLKSIASFARLSEFPPIETSSAPPAVLVAGEPGPEALAALRAIEEIGEPGVGAMSARQAMRALEGGVFDCAVFLTKSSGDPLISLARSMRRHRRFQDLPIIAIHAGDAARAHGEPATFGVETLLAEHIPTDLAPRVLSHARRGRLMATMRGFLRSCAGEGVRDRLSGAFGPAFFGQHAARVLARGAHTGRALSVLGVRLAPLPPEPADIASARTLTEAARLINRLTRAEDCVGRLAADTFVVLMSATRGHDAAIAARRIEGVISNTMFRARRDGAPFPVATATAAVERGRNAGLEETIARVLTALNAAAPRTAER